MNILDNLLEDYKREDYNYILDMALAISSDDPNVMDSLTLALDKPKQYFKTNAKRFDERFIDFEDEDLEDEFELEDLFFLAMVDELQEHGHLFEVDWKCSLEDFLWALQQLKNYNMISNVISSVKLDEKLEVDVWIEKINEALGGKAYVCYTDIDSDSYPLIIVDSKVYKMIHESDS